MRRLSAAPAFDIDGIRLIPVVATQVEGRAPAGFVLVTAAKAPVAVVVCSRDGNRAFDLEGRPTPLDDLLRTVDGLRDLVWQGREEG